jgi:pimeloyl-ACP methyl ester carboxylesterase
MTSLPLVLIPGLAVTARLYAEQIPVLWRLGPVLIADHTRHASLPEIAQAILETAPPRFALAGLSMGGYIAFEIMRQAPQRVLGLALLDTTALPEQPEQTAARYELIELARTGKLEEVVERLFVRFVSRTHQSDARLHALVRAMAFETGPAAFERQERAILGRLDSRPLLAAIRCPALVLVGDEDELTPPERSREIAHGIPGSQLRIIADSGHLSTLEQPQRVNAALLEWLESVRAGC